MNYKAILFFLPGYFEAQYHVEATAAQTAFIAMAVATVLNVTGNRRRKGQMIYHDIPEYTKIPITY